MRWSSELGGGDVSGVAPPRAPIRARPWYEAPRTHVNPVESFLETVEELHSDRRMWVLDATCANTSDPDAWFPSVGRHSPRARMAITICKHHCPVAEQCLNYALSMHEHGTDLRGIWAGTTPEERRAAVRANRPRGATA